jgi:hypothetical protein
LKKQQKLGSSQSTEIETKAVKEGRKLYIYQFKNIDAEGITIKNQKNWKQEKKKEFHSSSSFRLRGLTGKIYFIIFLHS